MWLHNLCGKCFRNTHVCNRRTVKAMIVFKVILKSTFLSTSHVKCVRCNSLLSVKIKEPETQVSQ